MRIKNQFISSMTIFTVVMLVIVTSFFVTNEQAVQLNKQSNIARNIERGTEQLSYLSNDYFLYQESQQVSRWQAKFASLYDEVSNLNPTSLEQEAFVSRIEADLQRLNSVFTDVVSYLEAAPRNVSVRIDPAFQIHWSRMAVQIQGLAFDAAQLSQMLHDEADRVQLSNLTLVFAVLGMFGSYFLTNYLIVYRRTLKSMSELQKGIGIIGSGNLDHRIETKRHDEIGELCDAFNNMTNDLKTVIASKAELEKEIAEREKAEETLRQSEERFFRAFHSNPAAMAISRLPDDVWVDVNDSFLRLTEFSREEIIGHTSTELKIFGGNLDERAQIIAALREKGKVSNLEVGVRTKSGKNLKLLFSAVITELNGQEHAVIMHVDITERKRAEDALKASERQFRRAIEDAPIPIIMQAEDGDVLQISHTWTELTGYQQSDIPTLETWLSRAVYGEGAEEVRDHMYQLFKGNKPSKNVEFPVRTRSGESRYWIFNASSPGLLADGRRFIVGMAVDVTELKRVQEELEDSAVLLEEYASQMEQLANERARKLKDAERLAAIGQTAGMVGHDIRNPLQSIIGDIYLARTELISMPETDEKKAIIDNLQEIEKSVDYINKIVMDLQDFAKPLHPFTEETNLKNIIDDLLTRNGLPGNIQTSVRVESEAEKVMADSSYVKRILGNLLTNAAQAMPKGGKLTIKAFKEASDTVITVEDTGVGIPDDVKPRLFQPLFTTKSRGQGFGLAVCKRLAEALDGTVEFESEEGKGTKFTVKLPQKTRPETTTQLPEGSGLPTKRRQANKLYKEGV